MFRNVTSIPAPPPPPPVPKRPTRMQRLLLWLADNFAPCYMVRRTPRDTAEQGAHTERWLSLGYAPVPTWNMGTERALVTWKWNAQRLARYETARTGALYVYEAVAVRELKIGN
jgi:hypothetical protein